ncbi:MAG: aspartate--tRNA ligase [Candidatus Omnitrophica bacterium]|nr:aspartate--tRNA ligase [Candidatus Omnitrophota bacterium]
MLRTHTCGELNINNIGKVVKLCGWVARRRDHGKIIFIDLRDRYGITQLVFVPQKQEVYPVRSKAPGATAPAIDGGLRNGVYEKAKGLGNEFVILVEGKVNPRPKGTQNPKISTGEIELEILDLVILNPSQTLPFEIEDEVDLNLSSDLRLKYRYLDIRRKNTFNNLVLRHKLYQIVRSFLVKSGFLEMETPLLTKSTPEGARDFLVPSRLNPGHFYALPQSPQLFKQILMVAGCDRYFQIARCFRDEDLRADRQPEFTQLDLEMSFVEQEDIFSLTEQLMQEIFQELQSINLKISFRRFTFKEAIEKYKTDKPDLRKETKQEFSFVWITDFPLFKYNEEEKRWESEHHPFTAPHPADLKFLDSPQDIAKARAVAYDLVLNGVEIASGSLRIHQKVLQEKIFKIIRIDEAEARLRFGFLLEALEYGGPPHGGIAFGLDRFLSILANVQTIREVITFPKTQKGSCLLTGAPSSVNEVQLKELGLL